MKPHVLICLLVGAVQMSTTIMAYGLGKSKDSPANAVMFKTLINAEVDISEKIEDLSNKYDLQSAKVADLENKLLETDTTIAMQQSRISELENDLLTIEQKTNDHLDKYNDKISMLEAYRKKMDLRCGNDAVVAFSARVSPSYQDIAPGAVIKFRQVETNVGHAYDASTGEFVAPRKGFYVFYSNILTKTGSVLETTLRVNGKQKLWLYSAGTGDYGSSGNMVIVHLHRGDVVKMYKFGPYGKRPFYIHHIWSTFSGFLLQSY